MIECQNCNWTGEESEKEFSMSGLSRVDVCPGCGDNNFKNI